MLVESLIDVKLDDDVDTDEEINDQARKRCSLDWNHATHISETVPQKQFINNIELGHRVQHPEMYDRNGKFCAFEPK